MVRHCWVLILAVSIALHSSTFAQVDSIQMDAGYENNDAIGGPKSVARQLETNNNKVYFEHRFEGNKLKKWYDLKDSLNSKYGVKIGLYYTSIGIAATDVYVSGASKTAASGIFDLQVGWTILNRKKGKNTGTLYFKANDRHVYGGESKTSPMFHGIEASGYLGLPATGFRSYTFRVNELNWQQNLFNNRAGFVVGKVDMTNYFNFHGLVIPWQHFVGYGSSLSGTVNWGNQGLGAVVMGRPTKKTYVMLGTVDVFGDTYSKGEFFELGNYFQSGKMMYMAEIGFTPSYEERYFKKVSLTFWSSDAYEIDGNSGNYVDQGRGVAFSSHWFFNQKFAPYFRFGVSNGIGENTFYESDLQIGNGILFRNHDMLGTSFSVNKPLGIDKPQLTAECFYRYVLSSHLEFTPAVQWINNPSLANIGLNNPTDNLFYASLRLRATL